MADVLTTDVRADLEGHHEISDELVRSFDAGGFARVPGVLDAATIAAFAPVVADVAANSSQKSLPMAQRTVYQRAFLQEVNLWQRIEAIRPLVFSTKLARIAAELMGVDGVRLYHDQALVKEARGGKTPWHCDQYYWPLDSDRTVTVWIPLQDVPLDMGPLSFATGSHRVDLGRELDISEESESRIRRHPKWRELPVDEEAVVAGDVTFHQGWTFHGARPNDTDQERLVFTVIYMADGIGLAEPSTSGQTFDRRIWLPDSEVGRPIDSWLNPVLWSIDGRQAGTVEGLPAATNMIGTFVVD